MQAVNMKLPKCPTPICSKCETQLHDVRPYRADQPHKSMTLVHCLSQCKVCGQRHIGVRVLKSRFTGLSFIRQKFEIYTQERKAELDLVAHFMNKGQLQTEIKLIDPNITEPTFVVWFENTTADKDRVIEGQPTTGLLKSLLQLAPGNELKAQRDVAGDEATYAGLVFQASSIEGGQAQAQAIKEIAAKNGTIAWIENFDDITFSTAWEKELPSPGNYGV